MRELSWLVAALVGLAMVSSAHATATITDYSAVYTFNLTKTATSPTGVYYDSGVLYDNDDYGYGQLVTASIPNAFVQGSYNAIIS